MKFLNRSIAYIYVSFVYLKKKKSNWNCEISLKYWGAIFCLAKLLSQAVPLLFNEAFPLSFYT